MHSSKKLYGNCKVYSPDNILMFICSEHRADWYLYKKNLATIISENPLSIKLNFVPKGLGHSDSNVFYLELKENKCVRCGNDDYIKLTKHHIVPNCFRKCMEDEYKNHNSHDVVILCECCHREYEVYAEEYKKEIALNLGIDIKGSFRNYLYYKGIAKTLLKHVNSIPESVFDRMYNEISEYLNVKFVSNEDLRKLIKDKGIHFSSSEYKSWGNEVLKRVDNIEKFIKDWRRHFIMTMNPNFMPSRWDIENEVIIRK